MIELSLKRLLTFVFGLVLFLGACQPLDVGGKEEVVNKQFPFDRPLNIAHRGARSLAPENTLLAAQKGLEVGADMWELDVALTYDGEIVVIHDDTLTRTSDAEEIYPKQMPWVVRLFTLDELRRLDFGSWYIETDPFKQIAEGVVSQEEQQKMKGAQIPTLREALDFTKESGWRVNIEIKDLTGTNGDAVIAEQVVALVTELDMVDRVMISSFNHGYIQRVKDANAAIPTAALVENAVSNPVALLENTGAQAYNPGIRNIGDLSKISLVREAGYDVYVWTVNDVETMHRLIQAGVSGIFTDFPQTLEAILAEYEPNIP